MKYFSNKYIFTYSAALVALVAVLLSVVAMGLKGKKDDNVRNEKMQVLLAAIKVQCQRDEASHLYRQYFIRELTVGTDGEVITDYDIAKGRMIKGEVRAFDVNLKQEQAKEKNGERGAFPIYLYEKDGRMGYVIPTRGNGLWGPVYANLALGSDLNTVVGVVFGHDSETPGLGAEISTEKFQSPFVGKKILDDEGRIVSIAVKKNANPDALHEVDAISGGTMTSNGVSDMLVTDLTRYQAFITKTLHSSSDVEMPNPNENNPNLEKEGSNE